MSEPASAPGQTTVPAAAFWASRSSRPWVFAATLATMFMVAIEATIVATAMPTIVGQLGGFDLFSWVFTAYLMTQAVTIPIYGRLADLYGRKRVLYVGTIFFLLGSVLCGFAWSMTALIGFRVMQGVGAGALLPVSMTLVGDLYAPAERARIQGLLSGTWGAAAILGPLLGAFLVTHLSWPAVFWVNVPIGIVAGSLIALTLHERVQERQHRIDYLGSLLLALGTGLLMFVLVQGSRLNLALDLALTAAAALALALFLIQEMRAPEPMLPLDLFRNRILAGGMIVNFGTGAVVMGTTAFLPAYIQGVMGRSALAAGLALMGMSASWSCGSALAGPTMLRTSYRFTATLGGAVLIAGSLILIALDPERGALWAGAGAVVSGLGMGLVSNSFLVSIQSSVEWHRRGVATSTAVFMRMTGQGVGTAVFGGILNAGLAGDLAGGGRFVDRILDPTLRQSLPAAQIATVMRDFAQALHNVYLIGGFVALVILAAALLLPAGLSPVRPARSTRSPS
ncbi:MAG TPA: MDR family MFS transporter [Stellaceae bacterium]|nr:MDR family MFS transporter [Stellaceae bacterium]